MADGLLDMSIFARIVGAGSLSAAARDLGLSLPTISKRLAALEARLGVRLLNRTTRSLALTEDGAAFHARCLRILREVEEAEAEAAQRRQAPTGLLRVTSTVAFGRARLAPLLREFQSAHPGLRVHLHATDATLDLVAEGFDFGVRFGSLPDSSLVARRLAPNYRILCAAPAYLDRHGRPQTAGDLAGHHCVTFGDPPPTEWRFDGAEPIRLTAPFTTNDGDLAHRLALDGAGVILKSIWDVGEDIAAGHLAVVLPDLRAPAAPLHAVYPHAAHLAPKVRLCVDLLASRLREAWRWPMP